MSSASQSSSSASQSSTSASQSISNSTPFQEGLPSSQTVRLVADKIQQLYAHGYTAVEVKRDQDHVSDLDPVRLHGFVMVKLYGKGKTKFMRLDWGEDGLGMQLASAETAMMTYMGAGKGAESTGVSVGAVAGAAGLIAVCAAFWWMTSITLAATVASATLGVGSVGVAVPLGVYAAAENAHVNAEFSQVHDPSSALPRLHEFLSGFADAGTDYSLASWNCNHFANKVKELLTTAVRDHDEQFTVQSEAEASMSKHVNTEDSSTDDSRFSIRIRNIKSRTEPTALKRRFRSARTTMAQPFAGCFMPILLLITSRDLS